MSDLCNFLEWDSVFFGLRIASSTVSSVNSEQLKKILLWCTENNIECLYFLADPNSFDSIKVIESNGFHFVDIRLTLEYNTRFSSRIEKQKINDSVKIRHFEKGDLPFLKKCIIENHKDSRFFRDPMFSEKRYQMLYTYWIEKECNEQNTYVFIATFNDKPVGYITCKIATSGEGYISLSGVNADYRNLGVGSVLMDSALACFSDLKCNTIKVVTQGSNIKAQRLYTSNGFYPSDVKIWFHKWFTKE